MSLLTDDPLPFLRGLYQVIPEERLAFILQRTGRQSQRHRRLPASSVTWLVVAMGLFADLPIPQVWRRLHPSADEPEPVESAFTQARQRLGVAPLRQLFAQCARPMATHQTVGAFYRGWRLMGLDSTVLDLPDTPANDRAFGRPRTRRATGAFPQLRLLALCELGTHAICGLNLKPCRRNEQVMVPALLDRLETRMLLLWDRGYVSYDLVRRVLTRGAHLLARVQTRLTLAPLRRLSDGSYLAKVYASAADRDRNQGGLAVRVIEYTHDDPQRPGCGQRHRLITDLLNPADLPAAEAPLGYHERWEEELALDEIKTHLSGREVPLRSKTPAGVVQEVYGLILAHYIVRRVMHDAALTGSVDSDRLSFSDSLRILHCHLPEAPHRPAAAWYFRPLREPRRQRLRPRPERWGPPGTQRKKANGTRK